jgi:uncharacterized ferritin-like protein (DUF455 family)
MSELRAAALRTLGVADADARCHAAGSLDAALVIDPIRRLVPDGPVPAPLDRPRLVAPGRLPVRDAQSRAGRAALLHAVAHIEFNAIGLALDAIWRFPGMPATYYRDWVQVAREEARHFRLLADHLRMLGHAYGDFDAHDGLWEMARRTSGDVLERMALVPRRLEARGLDASPPMRARLQEAGDQQAAAILDTILRDEIGHVAIGNRWYHWLCRQRGLDPVATDAAIARRHRAPLQRGPFNLAARRAAGFSPEELRALDAGAASATLPSPD